MKIINRKKTGKRQIVRMFILLISFAVFPITVVYLAPAPPILSLKAEIINISVITIITIFISGFIFRRVFCGWLCPGGGCQLVANPLNNKRLYNQKTNWFRIILVSIWVVIMMSTLIMGDHILKFEPGNPGAGKFATSEIRYFLPYIPVVVFLFLFVLLFGKRGFCHKGCWIYPLLQFSTWTGKIIRTPSLYVEIKNKVDCNDCKLCTNNCSMSIDINRYVRFNTNLPNNCIQCGTCVDKCPNNVLKFSFGIEKKYNINNGVLQFNH
jgi:ferredoxin-type protein NapH